MSITITKVLAACDALVAARPKIDYTQNLKGRRTGLDVKRRRWVPGGKLDCSMSAAAIAYVAGANVNLANPLWNVNVVGRLVATGLYKRIKVSQYKTLAALRAVLKPGDVMRGPGHVITVRDSRRWLSWERPGHNGYRAPYMRSRGWTDVARLISPEEFQGRILAAKAQGASYAKPLGLLQQRSTFDGPLWTAFLKQWAAWDRGMNLAYNPSSSDRQLGALPTGHVFVVLGSSLRADGFVSAKFVRRLSLAKAALIAYPATRVLVTGGKPVKGVTEAAAGKAWLVSQGIDPKRILTEDGSASTIGNATGSLKVLRKAKATTYTLVSDASHLRRASVLFAAAQLQIESAENTKLGLAPKTPLAFNDYAPAAVATGGPVSATTRATVVAEVASLLRLTQQFEQAR